MIAKVGDKVVTNPRALNVGVLVVILSNLSISVWLICRYPLISWAFLFATVSSWCWCMAIGCIVQTGFSAWLKRDVLLCSVAGYLLMCAGVAIGG